MKKLISLLVVLLFVVSSNVYAEEYKTNTLIPVDTKATVETDKFDYKNFYYDSKVDAKGNNNLRFEVIQNNTLSKIAVSINVLLFDENEKNIGYVTYCTDKDVSSNYAGFKLYANQAAPFNITVTEKYLIDGKLPMDVKYIAVKDENKYCQIGGYDNFKGLTISEIVNGVEEKESSPLDFLKNKNLIKYLIFIIIGIGIMMLIGFLIKILKNVKLPERKPKKTDEEEQTVDLSYSDVSHKDLDLDDDDNSVSFGGLINNPIEEEPVKEEVVEEKNPIEDLYSSLNEEVEEDTKEETPVEEIYSSINELEDHKIEDKEDKSVSIDDLYDSINQDDDDDDE